MKKSVSNLINNHLLGDYGISNVNEIYLQDAGIKKIGYGQYNYITKLTINDKYVFNLKLHTNNSLIYDTYNDLEFNRNFSNLLKIIILNVINSNLDNICQKIWDGEK